MQDAFSDCEDELDALLEVCAARIERCYEGCVKAAAHALESGLCLSCVTLLLECAQSCATSRQILLQNPRLSAVACDSCARLATKCAQRCEPVEDEIMQTCARACRACASSCRAVAVNSRVIEHRVLSV
jgi:hypothetical protein